jgi:hypothetical protein
MHAFRFYVGVNAHQQYSPFLAPVLIGEVQLRLRLLIFFVYLSACAQQQLRAFLVPFCSSKM